DKTPKQLSKLMGISEKLAIENAGRFSQAKFPLSISNAKQAIFAFQGDTYQGLSVSKFSEEDLVLAQLRIRILSGLFGVLAPQDLIFPYRLEMGTKLGIGKNKDLYDFWREKVTDHLNKLENEFLVNCASDEYFSVIDKKRIKAKIINPIFLDREKGTSGKYKNIGFFAKRARGMLSRFIILEKINEPSKLSNFNFEGYTFDKSLSKEDRPVFKREFIRKTK
ncbi:MAG: YaaA family protein, partial [Bacteriovoracales bacterium]